MNEPTRDPDHYSAFVDGDEHSLGSYDTAEEAHERCDEERRMLAVEGRPIPTMKVWPVWIGEPVPDPRRIAHA